MTNLYFAGKNSLTTKKIKIPDYPRVALVLQGGGALGSYQAGVVQGLEEINLNPTWLAGISIGALNCAIIAGNPPHKRVEKLRAFWETICRPPSQVEGAIASMFDVFGAAAQGWRDVTSMHTEKLFGTYAAMQAITQGQAGFFLPRPFAPGNGSPSTVSYYDTSPLYDTLLRFADFDRINNGEMRVSVGATNVKSGNFVYFDNREMKLQPEHFIASGALPPGFPAVEIDGEYYWDGGCVSNTPLDLILNTLPREDTLVFQVDLWSARGELPTDIFTVMERQKDIQYSSRTREVTHHVNDLQKLRQLVWDTIERVPASVRKKDPWFDEMHANMFGARYNCIHLIYKNKLTAGHYKDFEFSHETMSHHWNTGLADMRRTLENPSCLDMPPPGMNFVDYDVHRHQ
jgi:NTE family protein